MNWKTIISDLIDAGVRQVEIASFCETSQSYISDLLNGKSKQPNWAIGDSLLRLHRDRCEKQAA